MKKTDPLASETDPLASDFYESPYYRTGMGPARPAPAPAVRPMTPWVKHLAVGTYCFVTGLFLLGGLQDPQAFGIGIGMAALGGTWAAGGIEWIAEAVGKTVGAIIFAAFSIVFAALSIAVHLAALYFLVRFIKWAWINE